jgi:ABC-type ATPase with predicted acetyltransferase domain
VTDADPSVREEFWLRVRPKDFRTIVGLIGFEPVETADAEDAFQCNACGATVQASDDACPRCGLRFEE